ncbi:MAG: PQQ-binding-like beta-propeller repeat protein [Fuerstiella sp.]
MNTDLHSSVTRPSMTHLGRQPSVGMPQLNSSPNDSLNCSGDRSATSLGLNIVPSLLITLVCQTVFTTRLAADNAAPVISQSRTAVVSQQNRAPFSNSARLLSVADRQLELGNQDVAFDALQALFASDDSGFSELHQNHSSNYDRGISKLRSASFQIRSAWTRRMESVAKAELQQGNLTTAELRLAARKYPFTESGLHASLLLIRNMTSRQQSLTATAAIKRLQEQYDGITVRFPARSLITIVAGQVNQQSFGLASPHTIASAIPDSSNLPSAISSWQPAWSFKENVWQTPQLVGTFSGLSQPEARSDLKSNSWQPNLYGNQLILRTPHRIVCLNLATGKELWSIRTDTVTQNPYQEMLKNGTQPASSGRLNDVLRSNDFGGVTRTDDFLFFVDHFRIFESNNDFRSMVNLRLNRNLQATSESKQKGTRLVAVRLTEPPTIAWTTPTDSNFRYEVTSGLRSEVDGNDRSSVKRQQAEHSAATSVNDFDGHNFLGPPLLFEQSLFVLTSDGEDVWLNNLMKGTGRLIWRHPIHYENALDGDLPRLTRSNNSDVGASVVGIHNDTILSLLNTGVVVGSSLPDGRVKWATSVSKPKNSDIPLPRSARYLRQTSSATSFPGILHKGHLIWAAARSEELTCLNASTGTIKWQIPRISNATGQADRSEDLLPAEIIDGKLIMTGTRHVRAINVSDGSIAWTTGVNSPNGKAIVINDTCWVPTLSGNVIPVDVNSGELGTPIVPTNAITGSLYRSGNRIVATTPISAQAYPLFQKLSRTNQANSSAHDSQHQIAIALDAIHQLSHSPESNPGRATNLLKALKLLTVGQQQFVTKQILNAAINNQQLKPIIEALSALDISEQQAVRRQILINQQPFVGSPDQLIPLTPDWVVRLDLTASAAHQSVPQLFAKTQITEILSQPTSLQALSLKHSGRSQNDYIQALTRSRPDAAELAILSRPKNQQTDAQLSQMMKDLQALRNQWWGGANHSPPQDTITPQAPIVGEVESDRTDFHNTPLKFTLEQEFRLHMVNSMNQLTTATRQPIPIATRSPLRGMRLFLKDRNLFTVNLNNGSVSKSLQLSASPDHVIQGGTPPDPLTPSLLPIVGRSDVGVVSLVNPQQPKQLWWKQWNRAQYDNSPLRSGPVTPSGIIFSSNHRISCLHPLTGATLWQRDFSAGGTQSSFSRQIEFAADTQHLIALSPGYRSGTVFQMSDGRQLKSMEYDLPAGITPVVSGSRMLFPIQNRLKLIELATGSDLLQDTEIKILPSSSAQLLTTSKAIVITQQRKIAVLNLKTAQLEYETKLAPEVLKQPSNGIQTFEHGNRLIINFRQWNGRSRELSASSVVGDRRLTSGTLVSISPTTGEQWSLPIPASVLMEIAGDPAPFLVLWSRKTRRNRLPQAFDQPNDSPKLEEDNLLLRIVNQQTGQELLRSENLGWGNPLRCFHDSESQTITIETDASEIQLRYTEQKSDSE